MNGHTDSRQPQTSAGRLERTMSYLILCDSCTDFTEDMKQDPHFAHIPLTIHIGDYDIIDDDTFRLANEKRIRKATTLDLIPDDLQKIRKRTYCSECGHRLSRIGGNSKYEKWDCRNPDCYKFEYRLTDQMIIGAVLNVLNSAIANPSLLELGGEISTYSPTADIVRKQNEINHMTDSAQADFDRVKAEIFKLAEMKYDCCTYNDSPQKTDKIK